MTAPGRDVVAGQQGDRLLPHLLRALAEHGRWLHRQGIAAPPELSALLNGLAALNGLERTVRDVPSVAADAPAVRLIGEAEVARCLSLSPRTVRRLLLSGELPSVLIGRARRVLVEDLDRYLASLKESRPSD